MVVEPDNDLDSLFGRLCQCCAELEIIANRKINLRNSEVRHDNHTRRRHLAYLMTPAIRCDQMRSLDDQTNSHGARVSPGVATVSDDCNTVLQFRFIDVGLGEDQIVVGCLLCFRNVVDGYCVSL